MAVGRGDPVTAFVKFSIPAWNRLADRDRADRRGTTTYTYDLAGRMTTLTDPDHKVTTWTYTQANEVATEVNPLGYATTYTHDLVGNVTSVVDPNSHTITYAYDADNRETGETWVNLG